jgi:putative tryptophan/tyrosine transport system substrate-binding protein
MTTQPLSALTMLLSRHTRRREFITLLGGAAAWPLAARAQQAERMRRVGVLMPFAEDDPEATASISALRRGLLELGWREGNNLKIEYRFVPEASALKPAAAELVALAPEVIVCRATPATTALKAATTKIPIVFTVVVDPASIGFVQSWARPGANITGFANFEPSMAGKWLEVLKEAAPRITRAAILFNPNTAPNRGATFLGPFAAAARELRLEVNPAAFENEAELEPIFATLERHAPSGLIAMPDLSTALHRDRIIALAAQHRIPASYPFRYFTSRGGLISYGADTIDLHFRAASYVDRILRGTSPAELPVQQPSKFELVINLKTAKALGLDMPPTLLARADEVIE